MTQSNRGKPQDESDVGEEQVEDLEAPADQQEGVAGGMPCAPTRPNCGETT
jgi:hypothetical protein